MTRLEVLFENLGRQIGRELEVAGKVHSSMDESVTKLTAIVDRQDDRLDALERSQSRAIGAIAVIIVVTNLVAPVLLRMAGLVP